MTVMIMRLRCYAAILIVLFKWLSFELTSLLLTSLLGYLRTLQVLIAITSRTSKSPVWVLRCCQKCEIYVSWLNAESCKALLEVKIFST